jgi:hypothetical protein
MKLLYAVLIFFIFFFLLNIIDGGVMVNRSLRLIPNLAAIIIIYWFKEKRNKYIVGFLILLLLSALVSFGYENIILRRLTIVLTFFAYLVLGFSIIPKIEKLMTSWYLSAYFIVVLLVTIYLLSVLLDVNKTKFDNTIDYYLFMFNIIAFVFALASAILYVHHSPTKNAMIFFLTVVVLILSEMTRFALYYSDLYIDFFYYSCRFLYVLGLSLLIFYCGLKEPLKFSSE